MKSLLKKEKGFTLIEIVLVLAIAAFIILLVFLALTGANKSRRDTARKQEAGQLVSYIENFESSNNGQVTGFTCGGQCGAIVDVDTGAAPAATPKDATLASGVTYTLDGTC